MQLMETLVDTRKAIMTEIDCSLNRLGTDYNDLYQVHRRSDLNQEMRRPGLRT